MVYDLNFFFSVEYPAASTQANPVFTSRKDKGGCTGRDGRERRGHS